MSDATHNAELFDAGDYETNYRAGAQAALAVVLLILLVAPVNAVGISSNFLAGDDARIAENVTLRSWSGIRHIWRGFHQFPDVAPLSYTVFLVEAHLWGVNGERVAVWYRTLNLLIHIGAVVLLYHLLSRLALRGAWVAAAVFGVHPVNVSAVSWISQRPALLGSFFSLLTLIVLFRILGLNPKPAQTHRLFRLPESPAVLWAWIAVLLALTVAASPAVAATLAPVTLVLIWWEKGRLSRNDVKSVVPLLLLTGAIVAASLWLSWRAGAGDLALPQCPGWYRPIAAVQQLIFYAISALAPLPRRFAYEPFERFGVGAILSLLAAAGAVAGSLWALFRVGRGMAATVLCFFCLLSPSLIWVDVDQLFGGWVGVHRAYPATAAIIASIVCVIATRLQIYRDASMGIAAIAIAVVGGVGVVQAFKHRSQERLWNDVLAYNADHVPALLSLGDAALKQGLADPGARAQYLAEARTFFDRAVRVRPDEPLPLVKLGELEEAARDPDRAMSTFMKALRFDPENFAANFGLARALTQRNDSTGALRQYQKVNAMKPDDPVVLNNIALIHAERGEGKRAEEMFRHALKLDPRCTSARINLANLLYQRGDVEAAAQELTVVLEIDADNFEAFMNAGAMLGQMQQYDKAALLFRRAIELRDKSSAAYSNRAMALWGQARNPAATDAGRRGLLGEAEFLFQQAEKWEPTNPDHARNAAQVRKLRDELSSNGR